MAYTHRYTEASKLFRDVIQSGSDSSGQGNRWSVWYAFACVAAAANHTDDALQFLHEASKRGYINADALAADDDFAKPSPGFTFRATDDLAQASGCKSANTVGTICLTLRRYQESDCFAGSESQT